MITKEQFIAIMKALQETDEKEDKLNEAMTAMCPDFYACFYPTWKYKSIIIDLLNQEFYGKMEMDDYESDIDYFIYETNYGKKADEYFITLKDKTEIHFTDAGVLYDYLIGNKNS